MIMRASGVDRALFHAVSSEILAWILLGYILIHYRLAEKYPMSKAVFTMKLEPELRDSFMAAAAADDRPASQIVRELMRDYIEQRSQAREYKEFLRRKVEVGRADVREGRTFTNEEVEARFAARRAATLAHHQTPES
jgi:predicted transcriptional regulator